MIIFRNPFLSIPSISVHWHIFGRYSDFPKVRIAQRKLSSCEFTKSGLCWCRWLVWGLFKYINFIPFFSFFLRKFNHLKRYRQAKAFVLISDFVSGGITLERFLLYFCKLTPLAGKYFSSLVEIEIRVFLDKLLTHSHHITEIGTLRTLYAVSTLSAPASNMWNNPLHYIY